MTWFWLLVVLAAAGVFADASTLGPTAKAPERVVLVGDSLAVGLEAPLRSEWHPVPFAAFVKGGTTLADWSSGRMASRYTSALNLHPTLLLVSLGTNDLAGKVSNDKLAQRAAELRARAGAAGAELVWLLPGDLPWSTAGLEQALRSTGSRVIAQPVGLHKPDHIHPTGASYRVWAQAIRSEFP